MRGNRTAVGAVALLFAAAAATADPALPAGVPDYAGVTAENFLDRVASVAPVATDAYAMPAGEAVGTFFVDPDGAGGPPDDANPGTEDKPFRTLARAVRELEQTGSLPGKEDAGEIHRHVGMETPHHHLENAVEILARSDRARDLGH